jgi:hypothetical protein
MKFLSRLRFERAFMAAQKALDEGRLDEAESGFRAITESSEAGPWAWFNLGLVYKFRHDWRAAREANLRCLELQPGHHEATWNLGVVATAIRDWPTARDAWRGLEIDVGEGEGAPLTDLGPAPVRLNAGADGDGEVIWGTRIDPCRLRIESIPLPDSGHRWHDVVLHDVVSRGERMFHGQPFGVFDELERMDPSSAPTHVCEIAWTDDADEAALHTEIADRNLGGEDWSRSVQMICASCSLSSVHAHDGVEAPQVAVHRFGLAGDTQQVTDALRAWASNGDGRRLVLTEPEVVG